MPNIIKKYTSYASEKTLKLSISVKSRPILYYKLIWSAKTLKYKRSVEFCRNGTAKSYPVNEYLLENYMGFINNRISSREPGRNRE